MIIDRSLTRCPPVPQSNRRTICLRVSLAVSSCPGRHRKGPRKVCCHTFKFPKFLNLSHVASGCRDQSEDLSCHVDGLFPFKVILVNGADIPQFGLEVDVGLKQFSAVDPVEVADGDSGELDGGGVLKGVGGDDGIAEKVAENLLKVVDGDAGADQENEDPVEEPQARPGLGSIVQTGNGGLATKIDLEGNTKAS